MSFLEEVYEKLDFKSGELFDVADKPQNLESNDWIDKGEWLSAANRAGAEKIFFVNNNPVIVFSKCKSDEKDLIKTFNQAWCLARPRLLFIETPGELTIYDLAQPPLRDDSDELKKLNKMDNVKNVSDVLNKLSNYHRDNIESGKIFGDHRFGNLNNRADKALIRDLKIVRYELIKAGLNREKIKYAHALIGRSIFIRYLEDRGILTKNYLLDIIKKSSVIQKSKWLRVLDEPKNRAGLDFSEHPSYYLKVLENIDFTYALFKKLAKDFNGDMFPDVEKEQRSIQKKHLTLIQDLLFGDTDITKKLFFYSYKFDIIPLELISSIYEEFYHSNEDTSPLKSRARQDGAYYTPSALAEFVISRVLSINALKRKPRIMDPACGSGIFLVEAFRRIVRYETFKKKNPLNFEELKTILRDQIGGIEINPEAANIAAFSLYLSMLHYLSPPAIDEQLKLGNKLPNLVASNKSSNNHFHSILNENAFDTKKISSNPIWAKKFLSNCADIVVGNPPWGSVGIKSGPMAIERERIMLEWCKENNKPISVKEQSEAFLWRATDILKNKGTAGMLILAGVLFKHGSSAKKFKKKWISKINLLEVFNFSNVRKYFFKANSPFLAVFFKNDKIKNTVHYWVAKEVRNIKSLQSVVFTKNDLNILIKEDLTDTVTWKLYLLGGPSDKSLVNYLRKYPTLDNFIKKDKGDYGRGFQESAKNKDATPLKKYRRIDERKFSRYSRLTFIDTPSKVESFGIWKIYEGKRLLIKRGIKESDEKEKGRIIARYESKPFCFNNSIIGFKLSEDEEWKYKIILGILWSSLARYYYLLITSTWGLWHHELHIKDELFQLPICLEKNNHATSKIIDLVDLLSGFSNIQKDLFGRYNADVNIERQYFLWEKKLSEAVFDLYNLNEEQIDKIQDMLEITLPFFYNPLESKGTETAITNKDNSFIEDYIKVFITRWNTYLDKSERIHSDTYLGANGNIVAIEFFLTDNKDEWSPQYPTNSWKNFLNKIANSYNYPLGTSEIILEGKVNIISNEGIVIIKRNEKRFWTKSLAREDADSSIAKRMIDTISTNGE